LKAEADAWKLRTQVEQLTNAKLTLEARLRDQVDSRVCTEAGHLKAEVERNRVAWERAAYDCGQVYGFTQAQRALTLPPPPFLAPLAPPPLVPVRPPRLAGAALRVARKNN